MHITDWLDRLLSEHGYLICLVLVVSSLAVLGFLMAKARWLLALDHAIHPPRQARTKGRGMTGRE